MAVSILLAQAAKPVGVPGVAREDFDTGVLVNATAMGGPFLSQQWSIIDKAVNIIAGVQSAAVLATPLAPSTNILPIDQVGTYLIEVAVDSGSGLGALPVDVARITFYAGLALSPLNPNPVLFPRRVMAFREQGEHNVPDGPFPGGNPRGWAEEWTRWFAAIENMALSGSGEFAGARVSLPSGGPAGLVSSINVAGVARGGLGVVDVTFVVAAPSGLYRVIPGVRNSGGMITVLNEAVGGFRIERSDIGGSLVDDDFNFTVRI